jgi:pyrroloquinoline quinone biosynthesis protein D
MLNADSRPAIERRFRLQFEPAQSAHVLLYPEGMIKLNTSAGEILKRCTGSATLADITADLERAFATQGLEPQVRDFLAYALEKHWVVLT